MEQTMSDLVLRDIEDGICTLTLNRPDKLNALNLDVFRELEAHIQFLADHRYQSITVGHLTGNSIHVNDILVTQVGGINVFAGFPIQLPQDPQLANLEQRFSVIYIDQYIFNKAYDQVS